MSDLKILDEAFAELERRADVFTPGAEKPSSGRRASGGSHRVLLAAASVVVVAAVATTVAVLAGTGGQRHAVVPAGPGGPLPGSAHLVTPSGSAAGPSSTAGAAEAARRASAARAAQEAAARAARASRAVQAADVPQNAAQLAQRLREVLGSEATFTYTSPAGKGTPYIVGTLTRTSPHRAGGFDLQVDIGSPGDKAICEDPGESTCKVRRLPDHSSLSIGREHRGDTLYLVDLVHPNGISLLMHVSTNSDPKGGGTNTSSTPPLSTGEMVQLLRSPKWLG